MEINLPTEQDILRDIVIQYVNIAFVYITDCNPPLSKIFHHVKAGVGKVEKKKII